MQAPFVAFRLVRDSASDVKVAEAFRDGTIGPFSARSADGTEAIYEPRTRVTARVVTALEVLYYVRIVE